MWAWVAPVCSCKGSDTLVAQGDERREVQGGFLGYEMRLNNWLATKQDGL